MEATQAMEKQNVVYKYKGILFILKKEGGLPWWLRMVKNPPANAEDTGSSPGPGRSHMPRSS